MLLLLTFFCLPSLLFLCDFLHLCTDIRSLTYLLSSLFFPMPTSRILVYASLLPWYCHKSQYHQQKKIVHGGSFLTLSVILSIITANRNGLNADPWCSPTLTLKLSVVPTAHLTTISLPSYISCTSRTYFSDIPDFLMQYHSFFFETVS